MREGGPPTLARVRSRLASIFRTDILVRVTNLGLGFILMTLVVALGATNTGNNGLYLLVSLFLATLVVSGVVSRRNVERIDATLVGPPEIFAGQPARFELHLSNGGRLPRNAVLVKIAGSLAPILFSRIPPGAGISRGVDLVFPRRGRRSLETLLVYSGYPIGLFRKGRIKRIGEDLVVYPGLVPVQPQRPDARHAEGGDPRLLKRGRGAEIRALREASFGDDPRDVHWPQTARQGRLIVKERAAEEGRDAVIVVDTHRPPGSSRAWDEAFERSLSEAASLALRLLGAGDRVGLALGSRVLPPALGPAHRRGILEALAFAEPSSTAVLPPALPPGVSVYLARGGSRRASRADEPMETMERRHAAVSPGTP